MIKNIIKLLILMLIFSFFLIVFNYYFSEKNRNAVIMNRNNLETKIQENISKLPVLVDNTNDVIQFNAGFEKSTKDNFKRNFWELFR